MKFLKLIGLFGSGFIVGGVAVALWAGHLYSRLIVSKEVDVAFLAAQQAEWLAELRLGETTNAIQSMENIMDLNVFTISQWDSAAPPDAKTRKRRDAFLTNVKVYHESYPVGGADDGPDIKAFLAPIPGRSPESTCKAGVCRLDDLRLDKLKKTTNSQ